MMNSTNTSFINSQVYSKQAVKKKPKPKKKAKK